MFKVENLQFFSKAIFSKTEGDRAILLADPCSGRKTIQESPSGYCGPKIVLDSVNQRSFFLKDKMVTAGKIWEMGQIVEQNSLSEAEDEECLSAVCLSAFSESVMAHNL